MAKYRIETIWIPEHGGIAEADGHSQELKGRRIVHVFGAEPKPGLRGMEVRVLTEEVESQP